MLAFSAVGLGCATAKEPEGADVSAAFAQAHQWDQAHQTEMDPLNAYSEAVKDKIEASWTKPKYSGAQTLSVRLEFDVDRNGRVTRVELLKPSGYEALDRSAVEAIRAAEPFPSIPAMIVGDHLRLPIEIVLTAD